MRLIAPIIVTLVFIPLIFELVPRNPFYGFRTRRTLSSDGIWYPANKMAGILGTIAGSLWLLVAVLRPGMNTNLIGLGLVVVSAILSVIYSSKLR